METMDEQPGAASYCGWCGGDLAASVDGIDAHDRCRQRLAQVDPPRYCTHCARRMVVQVTPAGWHATCSRHGRSTD